MSKMAKRAGPNIPTSHKTTHENGGTDEISVAGLNGVLADAQPPANHNLVDTTKHPVSGLTTGHVLKALSSTTYGFGTVPDATPTAHKTTHQDGGTDEISVAGLSGVLADAQTPANHNLIDTTKHPVTGLTTNHVIKALSSTTYGFGALPAHAVNANTYGYGDATNAGHLRVGSGLAVTDGTISLANPTKTTSIRPYMAGMSYSTSNGEYVICNDSADTVVGVISFSIPADYAGDGTIALSIIFKCTGTLFGSGNLYMKFETSMKRVGDSGPVNITSYASLTASNVSSIQSRNAGAVGVSGMEAGDTVTIRITANRTSGNDTSPNTIDILDAVVNMVVSN